MTMLGSKGQQAAPLWVGRALGLSPARTLQCVPAASSGVPSPVCSVPGTLECFHFLGNCFPSAL